MVLYIKNMVCFRCKMAVKAVLEGLEIDFLVIEMGRVKLATDLSTEDKEKVNLGLQHYALELMINKKLVIVERIKLLIVQKFQIPYTENTIKFSVYLSGMLHYDYAYLTSLFSEMEGTTIERFYIFSRIERVKELMIYELVSIKEIAYQLNYSSVAHLCLQFKKLTGHTPAEFKKLYGVTGIVYEEPANNYMILNRFVNET